MNRRGFLGALASAVASLVALPKLLQSREIPVELEVTRRYGAATIPDGAYEATPAFTDLGSMEAYINRKYLNPVDLNLALRNSENTSGLIGRIDDDFIGRIDDLRVSRYAGPYHYFQVKTRAARALPPRALLRQIYRQVKYQSVKTRDAILFARRTGYMHEYVDRPGHPLHLRMYYRHLATGRVRWSVPA